MFSTVVDIFADEILDFVSVEDLASLEAVIPCVIRMYKSSYLDYCLSLSKNMFIECSYCLRINTGKYRKGQYVCSTCISDIISISISS